MNFKTPMVAITIALITILAACGTVTEEKELTVNGILQNSIEAIEEVESYSTKAEMTMEMMGMTTNISIEGDITHNPDAMHVSMKMGMPGMTMDSEIYGADNEVYMNMFGEWFNMSPDEVGLEDFEQMTVEEMEVFSRYADEIELTTEDDVYILVLNGSGDHYLDLVGGYVRDSLGDYTITDEELAEMLENITLNKVDYEIHVDKETFLQTYSKFNIDMEFVEDGFSMALIIDGELSIFNVNNVESIIIPEEVREKAISIDEADLLFGDFDDLDFDDLDFDFDFDETIDE